MRRSAMKRRRSRKADVFAMELAAVTPALVTAAGGECEAKIDGVCAGIFWSPAAGELVDWRFARHHRLLRSRLGTNALSNLLLLCRSCHDYVHAHPTESYERGWLLRSSS